MATATDVGQLHIDSGEFRRVMGQFVTGVTVVTTVHDGEIRGMTANAFMSGSLDPPLCVVSIAKRAHMHELAKKAGRFVVNVLAHDQDDLAIHFAGRPRGDATIELRWIDGLPALRDALAHMAADIVAEHDCGDHTLFVGHLFHLDATENGRPLVYHQSRFGGLLHTRQDQVIPVPEFW